MTMLRRSPGRRVSLATRNVTGVASIRRRCLSLLHLGWSGLGCLSLLGLGLAGCMGGMPTPMVGLDRQLEQAGNSRAPALSGRWLALIAGRGGRDQVLLVDVERGLPVPLPGLNRPDAQPMSVAVNREGNRLAVVRQLDGRTELVLYRRDLMALEPIAMQPSGVPRRVSLSGDGRQLAVEVSRGGLWQIDLIDIP